MIYDKLAWLQWAQTKDGAKNRNAPKPLARKLFEIDETDKEQEIQSYDSPEDFQAARKKILQGGG